MSARLSRSPLVLLLCGLVATAPLAADAQSLDPQSRGSAADRYERIQREAATFMPGDPIEVSTYDGRLFVGAFEDISTNWVVVSVPGRYGMKAERVPILLIRTITPPRPHPEIAVRKEIQRAVWHFVLGTVGTALQMGMMFHD